MKGKEQLLRAKKLLLSSDDNTLAVVNGDQELVFAKRGLAPLLEVFLKNPELLEGASVADRITGKAAACILTAGRAACLSTQVISEAAVSFLESKGFCFEYELLASHILNRERTGVCPVEKLCSGTVDADEAVRQIISFLWK